MIPILGMSTQVGLRLTDATRDKQLEMIESRAEHARAIERFREKAATIDSAEALVAEPDVYRFFMIAYDLEDQIFGKAMMRKIFESDIDDRKALVNRLTDPRFREIYKAADFGPEGVGAPNFSDPDWQQAVVDRYIERQFIDDAAAQNEAVGAVLEFREKAGDVKSWYDVLKDADMGRFMRRALGIPDEVIGLDVDRQKEIFEKKYDLEKLKDPEELEKLERRYVAITDALDTSRAAQNVAVQLMNSAASGQFVPVLIDITAISALPTRPYR